VMLGGLGRRLKEKLGLSLTLSSWSLARLMAWVKDIG
jgi:hypothetical protein